MPTHPSSSTLLNQLEEAILERNIEGGFPPPTPIPTSPPASRPASRQPSLLLCLAQWVDLGYRDLALLEQCRARFPQTNIADLRFIDALKWKLTEAFQCLATENVDEAVASLEAVLRAGDSVLPLISASLPISGKAAPIVKRGDTNSRFNTSPPRVKRRRPPTLPASSPAPKSMRAGCSSKRENAAAPCSLSTRPKNQLKSTNHALSLGNIESARGRFVRRSGDYAKALAHFERAIAIYSTSFPNHPNCARALVNAAYVKGLIAQQMQTKIGNAPAKGAAHDRYLSIFREALDLLARAGEIYTFSHHQTGLGAVFVNSGHLHLESGNLDQAAAEAEKAYSLGQEKHDQILMARARILESAIELALADEELGDHPDANLHAALAIDYAEEAIELGTHTQNKRLLAEAYLMRGSAAADERFQDWETARTYAGKAAELLGKDDRDHLLKELSALKAKIFRVTGIDQTLRDWSNGQLGTKTFQQIQEEFAEIVIPKVWLNQGRNVTRVARQLSISPKKIRRILRSVQSRGL